MRGHYDGVVGLEHSLIVAGRAGVPEEFRAGALEVLRTAAHKHGFKNLTNERELAALASFEEGAEARALEGLRQLRARVEQRGGATEDVLLLGDAATSLTIYGSLGAVEHRLGLAVALSDGDAGGAPPRFQTLLVAPPLELHLLAAGSDSALLRRQSRQAVVDGVPWRLPSEALQLAVLAGRVGSPEADPAVPAWVYLAAGLKARREASSLIAEMRVVSRELDIEQQVRDGLTVLLHIFPELRRHVSEESSGAYTWERRLTVPLAARRLVAASIGEER